MSRNCVALMAVMLVLAGPGCRRDKSAGDHNATPTAKAPSDAPQTVVKSPSAAHEKPGQQSPTMLTTRVPGESPLLRELE
jgi:hypothetical protein